MANSTHPIVTERRKIREAPGPHFRKVAKTWEAIIGCTISPEQVVLCMAALKMVREAGMPGADPDNVADAQGYLSLLPEVQAYVNRADVQTGLTFAEMAAQVQTERVLDEKTRATTERFDPAFPRDP